MAVAFVRQQQISDGTNATSHSFTITTVTATNAVFVATTAYGGPVTGVSLGGVALTEAGAGGGHHDTGTDSSYLQFWYKANVSGGSSVALSVTSSASTAVFGNVSEFSGMGSSLAATMYGANAVSGTPNPGAITGGGTTLLALWSMADINGTTPSSYPTSWTSLTPSTTAGWFGAYRITPVSETPTGAVSSQDWNSAAVVFDVGSTTKTVTETGTGADAVTVSSKTVITETATGADAFAGTSRTTVTDTSSSADAVTAKNLAATTDAGAGADAIVVSSSTTVAETATGTDAVSVVSTTVVAETATGADAPGTIKSTIVVPDTAAGADVVSPPGAVVAPVADTATGTDAVSTSVLLSTADTVSGAEAVSIQTLVIVADTCTGFDQVARQTSINGQIVVGIFTGGAQSFYRTREWDRDPLFKYMQGIPTQNTVVLFKDGTHVEGQAFQDDFLNAPNVAAYYLGGHIYYVTTAQTLALLAAGYTVDSLYDSNDGIYGSGVYGNGSYSG